MKRLLVLVLGLLFLFPTVAVFGSVSHEVNDKYFFVCDGTRGYVTKDSEKDTMFIRNSDQFQYTYVVLDQWVVKDNKKTEAELTIYLAGKEMSMPIAEKFTNMEWTCLPTEQEARHDFGNRLLGYLFDRVATTTYDLVYDESAQGKYFAPYTDPLPQAT